MKDRWRWFRWRREAAASWYQAEQLRKDIARVDQNVLELVDANRETVRKLTANIESLHDDATHAPRLRAKILDLETRLETAKQERAEVALELVHARLAASGQRVNVAPRRRPKGKP